MTSFITYVAALKFKVSGDTSSLNKSLSKSKGMLGGLSGAATKMGIGLAAGIAAGGAAAGFLVSKMVGVGEAATTANARILSVATSMGLFGDKAGEVSTRLQKLAAATELQTGVDRNQIKLTQAKLLTFAELGKTADQVGGHFDRATAAAVDMASAGFGTAENNAVQLGKALNDPIKGITALRKSGITFTEEEKKKISTLVESNKMMEAQGVVLGAIEKQVGGAAAATSNASEKIKAAFSQGFEALSIPIANLLDSLAPKMIEFLEGMKPKLEALGAKAMAFGQLLAAAFSSGKLPGMLKDGLLLAGKSFINLLVGGVRGLISGAWEWIKNYPKIIIGAFRAITSPSFWKGLGNILLGLGQMMGAALLKLIPPKLLSAAGIEKRDVDLESNLGKKRMEVGLGQSSEALSGYTDAIVGGASAFAKAFADEVKNSNVMDTTDEKSRIADAIQSFKDTAAANQAAADAAREAKKGAGAVPGEPTGEEKKTGILGRLQPIISSLAAQGGAAGLLGIGKGMDQERNRLLKDIERNTRSSGVRSGPAVYA